MASFVIRFHFEDGTTYETLSSLWLFGKGKYGKEVKPRYAGFLSVQDSLQPDYPDGELKVITKIEHLPTGEESRRIKREINKRSAR